MPYEPLQIELYQNLGGINEKASEYITGDGFFLNLRNFGFERPGALVSRPGTTDHISLGFATFLAHPAGLAEYNYLYPISLAAFAPFAGTSMVVFDSGDKLYALTTAPYVVATSLTANATTALPIDFTVAKNKLYFANGRTFQELSGTLSSYYTLPAPTAAPVSATFLSATTGSGMTFVIPSGTYAVTYSWVRTSYTYLDVNNTYFLSEPYAEIGPMGPSAILYFSVAATLTTSIGALRVTQSNVGPSGYAGEYMMLHLYTPGSSTPSNPPGLVSPGTIEVAWASFTPLSLELINHFTLIPRFLDYYKNMLFMAGFSTNPNVIWHSEVGNAEHVEPENFFEVRTDNGDQIVGMKVWQNTLVVFKSNSVHEVNGDSPDTISLKDVTFEYGLVNNEAAVVWENKLWFIDKRGICEYNGPNTYIVSEAVSRTFATLDVSKAKAFHIKKRNEVWFCFGSTCLVYDYNAKGWTIYDNLAIEYGKGAEILEYGATTSDLSFFIAGTSHYPLVRFKDDVTTDRGVAITLISQAPYFKRMGDSTQEMFRRYYLDADVPSATTIARLNLKPDYGSSNYYSTTFFIDKFQVRRDFGVSAKSLSPEIVISASAKVTINGYALHARYLRSV